MVIQHKKDASSVNYKIILENEKNYKEEIIKKRDTAKLENLELIKNQVIKILVIHQRLRACKILV